MVECIKIFQQNALCTIIMTATLVLKGITHEARVCHSGLFWIRVGDVIWHLGFSAYASIQLPHLPRLDFILA